MELAKHDLESLRMAEEALWIAATRFDRAWMEEVLAEDFFEFGRSGRVYSRAECLAASADAIDAVLPLPEFRARYLGNDIVQTT